MKTSFKRLSEHDAIVQTINIYTQAAVTGDGERMKTAFYEDAMMHGFVGPDFVGGPIQNLFDWANENAGGEAMQARIGSVEIVETIATVRVEIENWAGLNFTDVFTLLKADSRWKIAGKIYHSHL